MDDPLDDALGLPPMIREPRELTVPEPGEDYRFARENISKMIGRNEEAIEDLMDIARISQHPRAYEVLSGMMKTHIEQNKVLMDLKKMDQEMTGEASGPKTINNTLIITPDEMLQRIKNLSK